MVFLLIKGNDLHTGISPSVDPSKRQKFFEDLNMLGMHIGPENRIVYVSYPNRPACTREAQLSLTRPLTFGNHGAPVLYKLKHLNFADHSRHILGDARSYYNRMAREVVYMYWNFSQYTGLISEDPFEMIKKMTYIDEAGETHHCEPPQYHPIRDAEEIVQLRGWYQWHKQTAAMHHIIVLKKDLLFRQKELAFSKSTTTPTGKKNLHSQIQRRFPVKFNITQPAADSSSAPPVLDQGNHINALSNALANVNMSNPHQPSSVTLLALVLIDAANTFLPTNSTAKNIPSTAPAPPASLSHIPGSPPITETDDSLTTIPISALSDQVDHSSAGSDMMLHRRSARKSQNVWADYHTSTISSETWQTPVIDPATPATPNHQPVHHNRTTNPQPTTKPYPTLGKRKRTSVETTDGDNSGFVASSSGTKVALANNTTTKHIHVDSPNKQLIGADHNYNEVLNQSTTTSDADVSPAAPIPHAGDIANTNTPVDSTPDSNLYNDCTMLVDMPVGMGGLQSTDVNMEREIEVPTDVEMIDANQLGNNGGTHNDQVGSGGSGDNDNEDDYFDEGDDNDSDYRDGLAEDEYEVEAILDSRVNVSLFASPLFVCLIYPTFQAKGRMEFYVKWKDYSNDHNSWLSKTALRSVSMVIRHAFSSDQGHKVEQNQC